MILETYATLVHPDFWSKKVAHRMTLYLSSYARKKNIGSILRRDQSRPMLKLARKMAEKPRMVVSGIMKGLPAEKVRVFMDRTTQTRSTLIRPKKPR